MYSNYKVNYMSNKSAQALRIKLHNISKNDEEKE